MDTADAIQRLALYFGTVSTRQGVLARAVLNQPAADAGLRDRLIADLRADLRADGSTPGGAMATIWRVHELIDLGHGGKQPGTVRVLRWMLSQQGAAGAFGEDCSAERHQHRVCKHFVAGFFSPGPATQRLAPITLPNGKIFRAEPAARFAVSCLALRAALRAAVNEEQSPLIEQHLASLGRMSETWTTWNGYAAPDMIIAGLHALAMAPSPHRDVVPRLVGLVVAHQDERGVWANADFFHVLEGLLAAGTAEARESVRRALPSLVERQRADGTFGATAQQERALIGLRALLWAR